MLVSHILREKGRAFLAVTPQNTLSEAARLLSTHRVGALLVMERRELLVGIVSDRDIVRAIAEEGSGALSLKVSACMSKMVATCLESDTIEEVMEIMMRCRFGHLPVTDRGRVVGMISTNDVVDTRMAETRREAQALKEYIAAG